MNTNLKIKKQRIILWSSVAIYTFSLPYAIVIYDLITLKWSPEFAGFVPRLILIMAGVAYIFYSIKTNLPLKRIFFLIPCIIISCLIICLEPNSNKQYTYT
jgi:hypothetical protein